MKKIGIKKIIRDLWQEKGRTITVLIAIILGTFSVAMMTTSYNTLNRNLKRNYLKTNPASFTIITDSLDISTINEIKKISNIKDVEIRNLIPARLEVEENRWLQLWLFEVEDFDNLQINTFLFEKGISPVNSNEMAIERQGVKLFDISIGGS